MYKPLGLSNIFTDKSFSEYPFVSIPQHFKDSRGDIYNIADGEIGDVAFITSEPGAIRANHYHKKDWHLSYLIDGKMIYYWRDVNNNKVNRSVVNSGSLIYTPPMTVHKMEFLEKSSFIAISNMNRDKENYELDTIRLAI